MMKTTSFLASLALVVLSARICTAQDDAGSFVRGRELQVQFQSCFSCETTDFYTCNICATQWVAAKYRSKKMVPQGVCIKLTSSDPANCITCSGLSEQECTDELNAYQAELINGGTNPSRSGIAGACDPDTDATVASNCDFGEHESGVVGNCQGNTKAGRNGNSGCCLKWGGACICAAKPTLSSLSAAQKAIVDVQFGGDIEKYCHVTPTAIPLGGGL